MRKLDNNKDGKIGKGEFHKYIRSEWQQGQKLPVEVWKQWVKYFKAADTDNSGFVTKEELLAAVKAHIEEIKEHVLQEVEGDDQGPSAKQIADWIMNEMDKDGNDKISKSEFRKGVRAIVKEHHNGHKLTKEEMKKAMQIWEDADTDDSGEVDMKELLASVKHHMEAMKESSEEPSSE